MGVALSGGSAFGQRPRLTPVRPFGPHNHNARSPRQTGQAAVRSQPTRGWSSAIAPHRFRADGARPADNAERPSRPQGAGRLAVKRCPSSNRHDNGDRPVPAFALLAPPTAAPDHGVLPRLPGSVTGRGRRIASATTHGPTPTQRSAWAWPSNHPPPGGERGRAQARRPAPSGVVGSETCLSRGHRRACPRFPGRSHSAGFSRESAAPVSGHRAENAPFAPTGRANGWRRRTLLSERLGARQDDQPR